MQIWEKAIRESLQEKHTSYGGTGPVSMKV